MESERSHRSGSELFICFTSRNCSSMKVTSKSIRSPGRNSGKFREPSLSLTSSLSRRLRSNGSIKGGQASPMFPTGSKKKGSSLETAEPSSPKVTCIGQVRVKTKKQGQKFRTRSKRRKDMSFRKTEQIQDGILLHHQQPPQQECLPHRNQRWVHLPLSICEAIRAIGAEFSCLLPCRSSCLTGEKEKAGKKRNNRQPERSTSSCRAVFAKWVMTSHENEEEKWRDSMEFVSTDEEIKREKREVVGEIEMQISEGVICNEVDEDEEEEEEGRVSICIPPRNALLLMRCRSEPLRMSALANRFWESPVPNKEEEEDQQDEAVVVVVKEEDDEEEEEDRDEEEDEVNLKLEEEHKDEKLCKNPEMEESSELDPGKPEDEKEEQNPENAEVDVKLTKEEIIENGYSSPEALKEEEIPGIEQSEEKPSLQDIEVVMEVKEEREESRRPSFSSRRVSFSSCTRSLHEDEDEDEQKTEQEPEPVKMAALKDSFNKSTEENVTEPRISEVNRENFEVKERRIETKEEQKFSNYRDEEEEEESKSKERENDDLLPDCLLLMMCEPKLSMEVSKETWVCSTDFIRYRPERKVIQKEGGDDSKKNRLSTDSKTRLSTDSKSRLSTDSKSRLSTDSKSRLSTDSNPGSGRPPLPAHKHQKPPTPPRRSISKPTPPPLKTTPPPTIAEPPPPPIATMLEQKLVNSVAYEPFVLTRCKSEPMRSSAKLAPEACFWKNMKLEPHAQGPPNLSVGATGIGF